MYCSFIGSAWVHVCSSLHVVDCLVHSCGFVMYVSVLKVDLSFSEKGVVLYCYGVVLFSSFTFSLY